MYDNMPILYILMRTDLDSMNPGKAIAQGSHAANQAIKMTKGFGVIADDLVKEWENQTYEAETHIVNDNLGFGTVIVLDGGTMEHIEDKINEALSKDQFHSFGDTVFDPSYPIRDGKVCHHIPLKTCGWLFTRVGSKAQKVIADLELHP